MVVEPRELAMFPLSMVLLPGMVLPLHIFEPRYLTMMDVLLDDGHPGDDSEFGVVLIERGSESGGGEVRSRVGTLARVMQAQQFEDGRWIVLSVGDRRIAVTDWLDDDPYPRGLAVDLDEETVGSDVATLRDEATFRLRVVLALASEAGADVAAATVDITDEAAVASYQIAALAPLGTHDRQRVLAADTLEARLELLIELLSDDETMLRLQLEGHDP